MLDLNESQNVVRRPEEVRCCDLPQAFFTNMEGGVKKLEMINS